ncbi:putative dynamin GTPase [Hypoxylon sp. FL1857]|nr:putative dynamin GTPase [Hypoxylon sp. FL1857]
MSTNKGGTPASGLSSTQSAHILNQIDNIRANGVGDSVSLPQIVICGDYLSEKTPVLERVTGMELCIDDDLYTRFPTEIILRHTSQPLSIIASIQPHHSRSPEDKAKLEGITWRPPNMSELPIVIDEAAHLLKIPVSGNSEPFSMFAADVLRIEVRGPTGLNLTIVDLPGLISVTMEGQTKRDVHIVRELVEGYLANPRTIILAVVQAPIDIADQSIVQLARKHDPQGQRTVGVVTNADLISQITEHRIATLAKSLDKLTPKLGFFLLKIPSPWDPEAEQDVEAYSQVEIEFFSQTAWKKHGLDSSRIGAENLKAFLQDLLEKHIERELPKVRDEVKEKLAETEKELTSPENARWTVGQIRSFLADASMRFYQLAQGAHDGNYQGFSTNFFSDPKNRLRTTVHIANGGFSDYMRDKGEKRKVDPSLAWKNEEGDEANPGRLLVTHTAMTEWVRRIYVETRGRELPGTYNQGFLTELFREQSSRWQSIATEFVEKLSRMVTEWVLNALHDTINEHQVRAHINVLCNKSLVESKRLAMEELSKLIDDEKKQPITYNHYYTDNIQTSRNEDSRDRILPTVTISDAVNFEVSQLPKDVRIKELVAMNTFVDNVCRQVIERHLMSGLPSIFCPQTVAGLSDEELMRIGSESQEKQDRRAQLEATAQSLRKSLVDLESSPSEL